MATNAQLAERLAKSSELLRLALLGAADTVEWRAKYNDLQALAMTHATQGSAEAEEPAKAVAKLLMESIHCDTEYVSGSDTIQVNVDHFNRLCDARNAAIRLLSGGRG